MKTCSQWGRSHFSLGRVPRILLALLIVFSSLQLTPAAVAHAASSTRVMCEYDPSLVGCWRMDENGGTLLQDGGAAPFDDASYNGSWSAPGKIGASAILLNGTSHFANVPYNTAFDMSTQLTVAAWIKPSQAAAQVILMKSTGGADGFELGLTDLTSAWPQTVFFRINASDTTRVNSTTTYPTNGDWMHVAATYDGTAITLFIDGVQEDQLTTSDPIAANTSALAIGAVPGGSANLFQGSIDDVRVYNAALNAGQIAALASSTPPGDTTAPAAPTSLNAVPGNAVVDLTWTAPADPDVKGYNLYRSTTSPVDTTTPLNGTLLTTEAYHDSGLTNGTTYYYTVKAVDTSNNVSAAAIETSAKPTAPVVCYALTLTPGVHGSTPTADPSKSAACSTDGQYEAGELITLTAVPDPGYHVSGWSGTDNDASTATTNTLTMPAAPRTVGVTYTQDEYTLTITSDHGTVTKNPDQTTYHYNDNVQLTASPSTGWSFSNWSGDLSSTSNPFTITIKGNTALTANYTPAGFTVTPTSGLIVTEAGGTATFTIVLKTQPTADVTIGLSSSDTTEGTVAPSSVTFTTVNWNTPQTVTVTGVDDAVVDGNVAFTIVTAAAVSSDTGYNTLDPADVSVTCNDNDVAGITVNPTSGLIVTEAGGTATFTIVLTSQPTANVTIGLTSSDTTEGTVSPSSVTFTAANWNTPQTVTVTGVNDLVDDGDILFNIVTAAAASADPNYNNKNAADVSVTNQDDDTAGITVNPTSGLTVTEAGTTATFTIVLTSQPTADVTIDLSSSDTTEGTVAPASVTFTSANWNTPQTVTVTGVNDFVDDGDILFNIVTAAATSADPNYSGKDAADVSVTNQDNDTAGITVNPTSGLTTTEAGGTATFTIVLTSQPTADVTIGLSSSDTTEGTVAPSSVTFTSTNWNTPQTVTVTGVDDALVDGNIGFTIITAAAVSADPNYNNKNPADVSVTNTDNDVAGITVNPSSGLTVTEAGGTATFTIVLTSQPTADVTISLSSSDTTEGTVAPSSVTFTSTNWNTPQTVTVTGVDDALVDGNIGFTIITAAAVSADPNYNNKNPADVSVTNTDNDVAGITVNPTSGLTVTEAGTTATFTIVLNTQPTANVTIGLSSSDTTEGTVSPASVTFTSANWNTPQTVTVTGVNDLVDDGDIAFTIVTAAATSADPNYNNKNAADVSVTNLDDDTAGITVNPTSGLTVTEAGTTATFTIVLTSQPTANVTIGLSSSDTTEGTVSSSSVTFNTSNWGSPKTLTITGVNDFVDDGDILFNIVTAAATSTDNNYKNLDADDVSVTNLDDDTAGITVNPTSGLTTTEAGGKATFTIVLNSQPTADVTVDLTSSDTSEGSVSPASVTFTAANWSTAKTVTITGLDDALDDGDILFTIETGPAVSADLLYNNLNPADVSVTNIDNDTTGITVDPTSGLTVTEAGGKATFTIVLNSQPTADVTIGLSSSDTSEGTILPESVTFTSADWNIPQTATITGVDDFVDDGDILFNIVTAAAISADPGYNGLDPADVSVTNTDDDTAGFSIIPTSGLIVTEAGTTATFTIALTSQPAADVTVGLSSSDTTEGTVSPESVTFTADNWSTPQTVTITGVDDLQADGNIAFAIVTAPAVSSDPVYNGLNPPNVSVTNIDNDTAGITVTPTSGLVVTEAGDTATFTIVLNTQPTANVTIGLTSSDTTEGTVSPSSVTFTAANWNTPQTVTVTGVNDLVDDGDVAFTIVTAPATSTDSNYSGKNAADVSVTNLDDDTAGITVNPTSGLIVNESGSTATFTIVLTSQPTANVTIGLTSTDTTEGTVSPASVTFTASNWSAPQTVTITGVDDKRADGNIDFTITTAPAVSADSVYNGMNAPDVSVTNIDNDTAGITVNPTSGLIVTEAGLTATFTIVLNSQPSADVTIGLSSSDTSEGTVAPASVTFTSSNWNTPQTITVTGVDDTLDDGDIPFTILTAPAVSADSSYNGMNAADVSVTNLDDDYILTIVSENGSVIKNPDKPTYRFGDLVQLTAVPSAGWDFTYWSGDASGSTNPITITIDGNKTITANYALIEYTLTVTSLHGTVVKTPDQPTYHYGDKVNLTATPSLGWIFANWSGDASGTDNPTSVTITKNTAVTANYLKIQSISLEPGWNLVSFSLHPASTAVADVLSSVSGSYDLVYAWDASGAHPDGGNWLRADNVPMSVDTLTNLDETMGFWIHMVTADTLVVAGSLPTSTNIALYDNVGGWNLVGFPAAANGALPEILSANGVGTNFSYVWAYHANEPSATQWKLFDRTAPPYVNDLTELSPGWGYWIKVSADSTWHVPY